MFDAVAPRHNRIGILPATLVTLAAIGLGLAAYLTDSFRRLELDTVDARFSVRGERAPPNDIAVVGIDDKTFAALQLRWPFTHDVHARLVDRLADALVTQIVFDVQFSEPSDTDRQSLALVEAISRAENVVLDTSEIDDRANANVFNYIVPDRVLRSRVPRAINEYLLNELGAGIAAGLLPNDPGGVVRRLTYDVRGLRTLPVVVTQRVQHRLVRPDEVGDAAYIDYYGPAQTIRHFSYSDVLEGRVGRRELRDKIVVVGATSPSLQDLHQTPTSSDGEPMSGPEIQANAIETALHGFPLARSGEALDLLLIVLLGVITPAAALITSPLRALLVGLAAGLAYAVVCQVAFGEGTILSFLYPILALAIGSVGVLAAGARVAVR